MLLHEFGHIHPDQRVGLVVEQLLRQHLHQLRFSHAGGAYEDEGCRAALLAQVYFRAADGSRNSVDRLILPNDPCLQMLLQSGKPCEIAFAHLLRRDAGPKLHHLRHVFRRDLQLLQLRFHFLQLFPGGENVRLGLGKGFVVDGVGGLLQLLLPVGQSLQLPVELLMIGQKGAIDGSAGGGFVQQVDRFVRQEPVGDVPLGKMGAELQNLVGDPHLVVLLVVALDAL